MQVISNNFYRPELPDTVKLIAVTKYATDSQVLEAYGQGQRDFGENYVLAALERMNRLAKNMPEARWHFCGHLQKNKVNKVVGKFNLIQSIDSLELAALISRRAAVLLIRQDVLLQINISGEENKFGFSKEDIVKVYPELLKLPNINILGLMVMAPHAAPKPEVESCFAELRELRDKFRVEYSSQLPELSMGMSDDYDLAIPQGSTMIRIGKLLFNPSGQN